MKVIHLFDLSFYYPHNMNNAKIYINKATKEEKILFTEEKAWEIRFDNSYPNVFYDKQQKKYRCYYSTFTKDDNNGKEPYIPTNNRIVSLCYAESIDGVNWIKPNLGLVEFNASKENNIIANFFHGTSVFFDEKEKDENKKYKLFTKIDYGNEVTYLAVAFSKDGINFSELIKLENFNPRADTHNQIIYDEYLKEYILVTRIWKDAMRYPLLATSKDFFKWENKEIIPLTQTYEKQVYSMPIFKLADYTLGLASIYNEGNMLDKEYDTVSLHLTYSNDYTTWHYIDQTPFIDIKGCIFSSTPIKIANRLYFYYISSEGKHTGNRKGSLMRAYVEDDRLAYLGQLDNGKEASITTCKMFFMEDKFYIDADIEEDGYILISTDNNEEVEVKKEKNVYVATFKEATNRQLIRLNIRFKKAKIYKIYGELEKKEFK